MRGEQAPDRADEQGREGRAAAEVAHRDAPGQALEQDQECQGGQGQGGALLDQGAEGVLAGEQHDIGWLVGDLGERDRRERRRRLGRRRHQQPRLPGDHLRPTCVRQVDDREGDRRGGEGERDGPAELGGGQVGECGQRERAQLVGGGAEPGR